VILIALFGGVAATWPLAAGAQPLRRVAILVGGARDTPGAQERVTAFLEAFEQLGWTDGRNVQIVVRWAAGDNVKGRKYAEELVALAPDVILATGSTGAEVMLKATQTVPIVFVVVPDPMGSGFVQSLSRPGGNATGFMMFEYSLSGKWLELLKEIAPNVTHAAVLRRSDIRCGNRSVRSHSSCCAVGGH
jgi:putative tryptophan/tyrosine transport system substrate-binding protein